MAPESASGADEKVDINEPEQQAGVLSSGSSANILLKPDGPPDGGLEAWLQVLGAFFMYFNTWGIVSSYGSYQTWYEESMLSNSSTFQISTIGAVQSFLMVFLGFLAGPVFDKGYFHALVRSGSLLIVLGTIAQAFSTQYWQLLLSQGVCAGVGMGCLAVPSVAVASAWFTTRLPLANGIIISASGFGGVVYPIMIRCLIPLVGFRYTSLGVALVVLATLGVANVVLRPPRAPRPQRAFLDRSALTDAPYVLFVAGCALAFLGLYTTFFYVAAYAAAARAVPRAPAAYLVTALNAASVPGRVLPGAPALARRPGPLTMAAASALALALLALCLNAAPAGAALWALVALYGFFTGAFFSLQPTVLARLTADPARLGTRLGMASTCMSFGLLLGAPSAGALMRTFGFGAGWAWSGVSLFLGAVAMLWSRGLASGWRVFVSI